MRLKSAIWVHALLRRCQVEGKFGAVLKKGAEEAGAVFVVINHLNGSFTLLAPPPGTAYNDDGERRFIRGSNDVLDAEMLSARIQKEQRFDSDCWFVEIEDKNGTAGLEPEIP